MYLQLTLICINVSWCELFKYYKLKYIELPTAATAKTIAM